VDRGVDGLIRYLLAFQDEPWRDDEELRTPTPVDVGDRIDVSGPTGAAETWAVGDKWEAPDGQAETLYLFRR